MIREEGHFAAGRAQTGSQSSVLGKELYNSPRCDLSFVAPMVGLGFRSNGKTALWLDSNQIRESHDLVRTSEE
jgi:hypothetical protein